MIQYQYERQGVMKTGERWEARLVSTDPTVYCLAGSAKSDCIKTLQEKFQDGSTWLLSKVQLDTKANVIYNSCSNKVTVLLVAKQQQFL